MQTSYAPLFKLSLHHDYFPAGNCPALSIVPTPETSRLMQQLGIRMVERDFGTEGFYADGAPAGGQLLQLDAPVQLSFSLRSKDPLFLNYTELPLLPYQKQTHYFTNLFASGSSETFLASGETTVPLRPATFTERANQPGEDISLFDELGNELANSANEQSIIQPVGEDGAEFTVNLIGYPAGRYLLREGDATLLDFVLQPNNQQVGDLGLFSVYIGDTSSNGQHILAGGAVSPASYALTFSSRATTWRYHLIDNNGEGFEDFQLVDQASDAVVAASPTPPETSTLPDGTKAVVLTSPAPIPLRQRAGVRFMLRMKRKGSSPGDTPLTIPLPTADANRISQNDLESDSFYSDLYTYL